MGNWNEETASWEWEEADQLRNANEANKENSISNSVIADIRRREKFGAIKYGKYLTKHTTEDTLNHLYEELLDACMYIKTEIEKRNANNQ